MNGAGTDLVGVVAGASHIVSAKPLAMTVAFKESDAGMFILEGRAFGSSNSTGR